MSVALRTLGNPLVLLGAALSLAYPVASAKNLFKTTKYLKGLGEVSINPYSRPLNPIFHKLQGISIFMGTKLGSIMRSVVDDIHDFKVKTFHPFEQGVLAYESRVGKSPTLKTQLATAGVLDGLFDPTNGSWKFARGVYSRLLAKKGLSEAQIAQHVGSLGPVSNRAAWEAVGDVGLHDAARASTHSMYQEMFKDLAQKYNLADTKVRKQIGQHLEALGVELGVDPKVIMEAVASKNFKALDNYWPHVRSKTGPEAEEAFREQLLAGVAKSSKEFMHETVNESAVSPLTGRLYRRKYAMIPDPRDLEEVSELLTPGTLDMLRTLAAPKSQGGMGLQTYSLRLTSGMSHLAHAMGKTYSWTAKGHGLAYLDELDVLKSQDTQGIKTHLAKNVYLPLLLGKIDPAESVQALAWSDLKYKAYQFFGKPEVRRTLGDRFADTTQKALKSPFVQDLTFKNAGAKLAGWFYGSTLMANPASAGLNVLQTLHGVGAVVGSKYLLAGWKEALKDAGRFADTYAKGGRTLLDAFEEAVPHYGKYIGGVSEIEASAALRRAMKGGKTFGSKVEQAKAIGMSLFTGSERFNKLVAYHAGRLKGLAENMEEPLTHVLGQRVMELTQFPGGILGTPVGLQNWWAPFRQFTQFPLRTVELALSSGTLLGAAEKSLPDWLPVIGGRNFGTLGRMVAGAGLTYGAGQMAGLDLSRGLLFGAMPVPDDPDAPFHPWPIVPPLVGLAGGVASDVFAGDGSWDQTRRNLPLLVPGGVALARATAVMSPEIAKAIGRGYADYGNRLPDGSIATYTSDGALKGYRSPMSLFGQVIGWNSLTGDPEGDLTAFLLKQRDKIREYRRQYVESIATNDPGEQERVEARWKREFPELGEIVVKPSDIRAVHLRHDVSRVERILETMPEEARALYAPMVGVALGEHAEQFLGVDPALLGGGTIAKRDPKRALQQTPQSRNLQQGFRERAKQTASAGLRNDHVGHQPNEPFTAFQSFDGFGN